MNIPVVTDELCSVLKEWGIYWGWQDLVFTRIYGKLMTKDKVKGASPTTDGAPILIENSGKHITCDASGSAHAWYGWTRPAHQSALGWTWHPQRANPHCWNDWRQPFPSSRMTSFWQWHTWHGQDAELCYQMTELLSGRTPSPSQRMSAMGL